MYDELMNELIHQSIINSKHDHPIYKMLALIGFNINPIIFMISLLVWVCGYPLPYHITALGTSYYILICYCYSFIYLSNYLCIHIYVYVSSMN